MRAKLMIHIVAIFAVCFSLRSIAAVAKNSDPNQSSKYLNAVRQFADNVLKYGRDTYGPKKTPLFVDGLNIHTHEPVKWIDQDGTKWILSNLSSQQDLLRTLDGLTKATGDPRYRRAAMDAIKYAFEILQTPNGLLHWGGHQAYDAAADRPHGKRNHELKGFYPYYELMWEVNREATKRFIEAFWSGHILDWSTLDMNRHCTNITRPLKEPWDHEYKGGTVFLESNALSFFNTGSDLIYAAAMLSKLSGEKQPLIWSKRLAHRYVETRHPKTGISYGMYTKPSWKLRESFDSVMKKLVPGTTEFLPSEFPWYMYTNPIQRKFYLSYTMPTPGIYVHLFVFLWQSQFLLGEMLGSEGNEFKQWALEELTAFGKASYRKKDNVYVPILTDGTNLEGYVVKEDGPLGAKGVALESVQAGPSDFWGYTMGYRVTKNGFMWEMARSIAKGNEFGDIGATPKDRPHLKIGTACSDPYALLAFLELQRATGNNEFVQMAERIGDNILDRRFHEGYFVASNKHIYTKFNAVDSLALLHLHATYVGGITKIPEVWPSTSFLDMPYRKKESVSENRIIYTLTESAEPPMSLQEAAAEGDLQAVNSMITQGTPVDDLEDGLLKTALHHAAIRGHIDVVELLLTSGADINVKDGWPGGTALHYAAENGHKKIAELLIARGANINATRRYPADDTPLHSAARVGHKGIAELLIAKGADINAKNNDGQTPIDIALEQNHEDIVELLSEKGADISIHVAAYLGDIGKVKSFIETGTSVNSELGRRRRTPLYWAVRNDHRDVAKLLIEKGADVSSAHLLYYACMHGHRDLAEFLIQKGADVNSRNWRDTPAHYAVWGGHADVLELLLAHGADADAKDRDAWSLLHYAAGSSSTDMTRLLLDKGADVNAKENNDRQTPLHRAAGKGHTTVVELLIVKGADVNAKDNQGRTPLQVAKERGHTKIVELLLKHGAKE